MNQVVETTLEYLPYAGAIGGAAAGAVTDVIARRQVARNNEALVAAWGDDATPAQEGFVPQASAERSNRIARSFRTVGRVVAAPLVIAGAAAGFANGLVWQPESDQAEPPFVGIVVDHSATTAIGESQPINYIDKLAATFQSDDFEATAFVAGSNTVEILSPEDVDKKDAWGDAPIGQAFNLAVGRATELRDKSIGNRRNTGIFVITNNNAFGTPEAVTAQAEAAGVPVFVADLADQPDTTIADGLKQIAKETEGEYWGVETKDATKIVGEIQDTLEASNLKDESHNRWPQRILAGVLSAGLLLRGYKKRSEMTLK